MNKDDMIPRSVFVQSGKKGGSRTAKRGKKFYQEIGKAGAVKRWEQYEKEKGKDSGNA